MRDAACQGEQRTTALVSASAILLAAIAALSFGGGCQREAPPGSAASTAPRNVLLITIDTVRADHIGAYGDAGAETPSMDALAREGLRFENAESAVPLTLPSHATILSGVLPQHHGLRNNGGGEFPKDVPTLATVLSASGFRTGAFVGSFVLDHRFGLARGFESYDDEIERDPNRPEGLEAERRGDQVADRAISWIGSGDSRPFFAWVHLYDAHAPYSPPEPWHSRHADQPYDGEIAFVDAQIGRLVAELDRHGLRDRTLIVVVGDHGEALGEHGELTHGLLLYEPTLRVPLIMSAPGLLPRAVIRTPVGLADLAPSIARLAGHPLVTSARAGDGRDLSAALLRGSEPPLSDVYSETEYPAVFGWSTMAAVRQGHFKYIGSTHPELFDLAADPGENKNIRETERRVLHALAPRLADLRNDARTPEKPSAMDAETRAKLESLGYVGGAPASEDKVSRPDPEHVVRLFREFEEATWALNAGQTAKAIPILEGLVRADPPNPVFRGSLARALRQKGDLKRAIELYREAVATAPDDPEAWYNLAVTFQEAGMVRQSAEAVQEAIRRDPRRPEAHNALGIAYTRAERFDDALAEFRRAIEIDPRDALAYNNTGNAFRAMNRLPDARRAYLRSIELAPRYPDPLNGLGTLEVQQDRPREALQYFDRALRLAPQYHEVILNRAIALELTGDRHAAAEGYSEFLRSVGKNPEYEQQRNAARELLRRVSRDVSGSGGGR